MIDSIVSQTRHRPWPLPGTPWFMRQAWHDLLFAHWPIPIDVIRALVPDQLEIDTFDGSAWLSIVPFRMSGVRPRGIPPVPWLSAFPELNVRTYVTARDTVQPRPGVFFFSLDAANPVAVTIARRMFRLPYYRANMRLIDHGQSIDYASHRTHSNAVSAQFVARYAPTSGIFHTAPNTLDHWLTARFCLYTIDPHARVYRADIHHLPWPLQHAEGEFPVNEMATACGITLPSVPPLLHFSRRLDVLIWPLRRIETGKNTTNSTVAQAG